MKRAIYYTIFLILPILMALYLLYRIFITDGLEKNDYLIMVLLFLLNTIREPVKKRGNDFQKAISISKTIDDQQQPSCFNIMPVRDYFKRIIPLMNSLFIGS